VYFVTKPDYTLHMDILQDINLRLVDALEEDGVLLAQPVQRLYLEGSKGHEPQLVAPAHSRAS
jgi:hypothetical protein